MAPNFTPTENPKDREKEAEDDYLTMIFDDPSTTKQPTKPTLTKLHALRTAHAETAGRPKSKSEIAAQAEQRRKDALSSSLLSSSSTTTSKAASMMAKMGYTPGSALGPAVLGGSGSGDRLLEPIGLEMKSDRGGVGADAEKKRKIREEVQRVVGEEKRRKVDEVEYRERVVKEREERRLEGLLRGARGVAVGLEDDDHMDWQVKKSKRLKDVNVLWRGMVKEREINDRDRRMRNELIYSSERPRYLPSYDDGEADEDDRLALGSRRADREVVDDLDLDDEDPELDEFEALDVGEKLERVIGYLRDRWHYCFWCKYRYPDEGMDGCPGLTEDEHG